MQLQGTAIPLLGAIDTFDPGSIKWVLVVEKDVCIISCEARIPTDFVEAVFRTLCSRKYWENAVVGPGLIVTVSVSTPKNNVGQMLT